jgi:hypothetical protein
LLRHAHLVWSVPDRLSATLANLGPERARSDGCLSYTKGVVRIEVAPADGRLRSALEHAEIGR